jgi:hypothetical protein
MYPGDECDVRLTFVNPAYVKESLMIGAYFDIMEGPHKVGEGKILSIPAALYQNKVKEDSVKS